MSTPQVNRTVAPTENITYYHATPCNDKTMSGPIVTVIIIGICIILVGIIAAVIAYICKKHISNQKSESTPSSHRLEQFTTPMLSD
ncbi:hypothetical protein TVAG_373450 [Trichomonas vaginalis G3]|uniref:Uncharacterized protein n=1 Tax=Trichomonas vaginalis (strain ATCC PRA-98 / G3) TaxID=412133 RepID=A2DZK8_TRIV3|nr:hypothetical protein TVAGG3_0012230 [Trichomonas vaginalis G3]EAY14212.1 hypothetical protein TVAG_373450 [Trichomonas vaginalis G3]KAI5539211.1 hypothetical protein TVAGG3_0012230 [Trichomonas vaginalis G3]|eukprot:XP_001326435.1 hypothetical protein [Trichomonas vaginalis G3]